VLFKSAMTLDGKVATRSGDSKWISGEASRARAHHWRAECDAVAVGIGTALADDPQLTARMQDFDFPEIGASRSPKGNAERFPRQPRRVVFDALGRLPVDGQLVRDARRTPVSVVVSRAAPRAATDALVAHGAEVIVATGENEPARVCSALDQLGAAGIGSILLEGGPHLAGAFMDAGEVDEIRLFLAPLILGGRTARDPIEGEGVEQIAEAVRVLDLTCERVDDDLLV
jgi:diaminohydroxyphosphoribosylaminopyrimidine deaminase/5-amino-6-(5-phosphoribosylamino)uracil reductase